MTDWHPDHLDVVALNGPGHGGLLSSNGVVLPAPPSLGRSAAINQDAYCLGVAHPGSAPGRRLA
ncbi:hypothetical protein ABZ953_25815 [Streptomyces sp. NPDC046465]|uniref:hypothetical protein n=1 Tax=Streptomyces sp. NPDC046465 TaxID=3155810 RepID=UPI00340A29E2